MACRTALVAAAVLALPALPAPAKEKPGTPVPPLVAAVSPPPDTAALARDIPRLLRTSGIPGLSMAVVQKRRVIWAGAFGTVNDSAQTPVDAGDHLRGRVAQQAGLRLSGPPAGRPRRVRSRSPAVRDARVSPPRARRAVQADHRPHGPVARHGAPQLGRRAADAGSSTPARRTGTPARGSSTCRTRSSASPASRSTQLARREVFQPLGMTRSSYVWQERLRRRRGVRQGLALARRSGQPLRRGQRRGVAAHDGARLRPVRRRRC